MGCTKSIDQTARQNEQPPQHKESNQADTRDSSHSPIELKNSDVVKQGPEEIQADGQRKTNQKSVKKINGLQTNPSIYDLLVEELDEEGSNERKDDDEDDEVFRKYKESLEAMKKSGGASTSLSSKSSNLITSPESKKMDDDSEKTESKVVKSIRGGSGKTIEEKPTLPLTPVQPPAVSPGFPTLSAARRDLERGFSDEIKKADDPIKNQRPPLPPRSGAKSPSSPSGFSLLSPQGPSPPTQDLSSTAAAAAAAVSSQIPEPLSTLDSSSNVLSIQKSVSRRPSLTQNEATVGSSSGSQTDRPRRLLRSKVIGPIQKWTPCKTAQTLLNASPMLPPGISANGTSADRSQKVIVDSLMVIPPIDPLDIYTSSSRKPSSTQLSRPSSFTVGRDGDDGGVLQRISELEVTVESLRNKLGQAPAPTGNGSLSASVRDIDHPLPPPRASTVASTGSVSGPNFADVTKAPMDVTAGPSGPQAHAQEFLKELAWSNVTLAAQLNVNILGSPFDMRESAKPLTIPSVFGSIKNIDPMDWTALVLGESSQDEESYIDTGDSNRIAYAGPPLLEAPSGVRGQVPVDALEIMAEKQIAPLEISHWKGSALATTLEDAKSSIGLSGWAEEVMWNLEKSSERKGVMPESVRQTMLSEGVSEIGVVDEEVWSIEEIKDFTKTFYAQKQLLLDTIALSNEPERATDEPTPDHLQVLETEPVTEEDLDYFFKQGELAATTDKVKGERLDLASADPLTATTVKLQQLLAQDLSNSFNPLDVQESLMASQMFLDSLDRVGNSAYFSLHTNRQNEAFEVLQSDSKRDLREPEKAAWSIDELGTYAENMRELTEQLKLIMTADVDIHPTVPLSNDPSTIPLLNMPLASELEPALELIDIYKPREEDSSIEYFDNDPLQEYFQRGGEEATGSTRQSTTHIVPKRRFPGQDYSNSHSRNSIFSTPAILSDDVSNVLYGTSTNILSSLDADNEESYEKENMEADLESYFFQGQSTLFAAKTETNRIPTQRRQSSKYSRSLVAPRQYPDSSRYAKEIVEIPETIDDYFERGLSFGEGSTRPVNGPKGTPQ